MLLMSMTEDDAQEDPNSDPSTEAVTSDGAGSDAGAATEDGDLVASKPSVRHSPLSKLLFYSCLSRRRPHQYDRPFVPTIGCSVAKGFSPHSRRLWL